MDIGLAPADDGALPEHPRPGGPVRGALLFGGAMGLAVLSFGAAARAEPTAPCTLAALAPAPGLDGPWRSAVSDLRAQLRGLAPEDCAAVSLSVELAPPGVRLVARADDGRRTARFVSRPSALAPIALGVVTSIPADEPERPAPTAALVPEPPPTLRPEPEPLPLLGTGLHGAAGASAARSGEPSRPVDTGSPRPRPPGSTELALGVAGGARVAAPSSVLMADLELRADLFVHGWLLAASFHYAPAGASLSAERFDSDDYRMAEVGLGFGRHFTLGRSAVDLALGPSVAVLLLETDTEGSRLMPGVSSEVRAERHAEVDSTSSPKQLRLGGSARWSLPLDRLWRLTVTLDSTGACSTLGSSPPAASDVPLLWTAGLRLGAMGALL